MRSLRLELARAELDALIVSNPQNVHYLFGFPSDALGIALVSSDWATLVTGAMFAEEATCIADGLEADLVPRGIARRVPELLTERLGRGARVGVEAEYMTHAAFIQLRKATRSLRLVAADDALLSLRAVKSASELAIMRRSALRLSDTFRWLSEQRLVGRTERDVAWMTERHLRDELGADGLAFPCVVACGPRAAVPHHTASTELIQQGQLLVIDIGCVIDGYRSDSTRTFATGTLSATERDAYELVRSAQQQALSEVRAGAVASDVHKTAADVIAAAGYGERFTHEVGHGVGLELHERPFLGPLEDGRLKTNEVLTVEPGVYLSGRFGVRIEDELVVAAHGYEQLTSFTKELITVS